MAVWLKDQISRRLLDPMTISVLRLKAILEQRGVSYGHLVEKTEITELVEATGALNEEELEASMSSADGEETVITNYTSHVDFYEQVEDAKDSMWLVEVIAEDRVLLSDTGWLALRKKVSKFGVRLGRLDCQHHIRLCTRKGWFSSRIVLALPENYQSKANVALYTYPGQTKVSVLFDWIKTKVNQQIQTIETQEKLEEQWLTFPSALSPDVRVVFVSTLTSVPLFLSALSVRFPGRVKIGQIKANTSKGKQLLKKLDLKSDPRYIIITKQQSYMYGKQRGEIMTFKAMEMFLKSVYPSMNDIFIVSIILTNIAGCFELCISKGGTLTRLIKLLFCLFQYNIVLLLIWVLILGLLQLPLVENITLIGLKVLRYFTLTPICSLVRKDMAYYANNVYLPLAVLATVNLIAFGVRKIFKRSDDTDEVEEESDWWNFSNLRTLNYYNGWEMMRLRPFDQIFNPSFGVPGSNDDVYHSTVTVNSNEYIKFLPVWVHREQDCVCQCGSNLQGEGDDNSEKEKQKLPTDSDQNGDTLSQRLSPNLNDELASSCLDANYRCECQCGYSGINENPEERLSRELTTQNPDSGWLDSTNLGQTAENPWNGQHSPKNPSKRMKSLNHLQSKPMGYLEDSQCVICLDQYRNFVLLRGLPCKHVFHDRCILAWLLRDNHFCPTCRWPAFQLKDGANGSGLHNE
ncbi:RN103-like protein [Mya arenaria]|uniref:RN103-like protein n=1 Tax=Mya arenaria TaxID=6604 RepID=A0ABY7FGN9_MYAAR|nr:RN103-like protein [Mya arenaria]